MNVVVVARLVPRNVSYTVLNVVEVDPLVSNIVSYVVDVDLLVVALVDLVVLNDVLNDVVLEVDRVVDNAVTLATTLAFNCFVIVLLRVSVNEPPAALTYVPVPAALVSDTLKKNLLIKSSLVKPLASSLR